MTRLKHGNINIFCYAYSLTNHKKRVHNMHSTTKTLVLGIGNTLLSDEGVGVHLLNYLQKHYDFPRVDFLDGGTLSFTLATSLENTEQLIVLDAAQWHQPPGTIRVLQDEAMDTFLSKPSLSVHEVSLVDLFDITRLTGHLPKKRALIGIQPEYLDWGDKPTEKVAQAIPRAAQQAAELIQAWQKLKT